MGRLGSPSFSSLVCTVSPMSSTDGLDKRPNSASVSIRHAAVPTGAVIPASVLTAQGRPVPPHPWPVWMRDPQGPGGLPWRRPANGRSTPAALERLSSFCEREQGPVWAWYPSCCLSILGSQCRALRGVSGHKRADLEGRTWGVLGSHRCRVRTLQVRALPRLEGLPQEGAAGRLSVPAMETDRLCSLLAG